MVQLITGIILLLFLVIFFFYTALTIKHAARFRYLSKRIVYLSVAFTGLSGALIALALVLYGMLFFN